MRTVIVFCVFIFKISAEKWKGYTYYPFATSHGAPKMDYGNGIELSVLTEQIKLRCSTNHDNLPIIWQRQSMENLMVGETQPELISDGITNFYPSLYDLELKNAESTLTSQLTIHNISSPASNGVFVCQTTPQVRRTFLIGKQNSFPGYINLKKKENKNDERDSKYIMNPFNTRIFDWENGNQNLYHNIHSYNSHYLKRPPSSNTYSTLGSIYTVQSSPIDPLQVDSYFPIKDNLADGPYPNSIQQNNLFKPSLGYPYKQPVILSSTNTTPISFNKTDDLQPSTINNVSISELENRTAQNDTKKTQDSLQWKKIESNFLKPTMTGKLIPKSTITLKTTDGSFISASMADSSKNNKEIITTNKVNTNVEYDQSHSTVASNLHKMKIADSEFAKNSNLQNKENNITETKQLNEKNDEQKLGEKISLQNKIGINTNTETEKFQRNSLLGAPLDINHQDKLKIVGTIEKQKVMKITPLSNKNTTSEDNNNVNINELFEMKNKPNENVFCELVSVNIKNNKKIKLSKKRNCKKEEKMEDENDGIIKNKSISIGHYAHNQTSIADVNEFERQLNHYIQKYNLTKNKFNLYMLQNDKTHKK